MSTTTQTIDTLTRLDPKGILHPPKHAIPDETLLNGYRTMLLNRQVDDRMITLQRQGTITFAMSSLGEEACSVASAAALDPDDWLYPQYRENGALFYRGYSIENYLHQMFGNAKDTIQGRQMPNHFGSREHNVVTVSSPIGTKIPHAAGCAYAMKVQKEPNVVLTYFGDGASSEGDFHVGLSFAAVLKAPVIFFCRNNGYAISTPCDRQFRSNGVAPEGVGHGITTYRIDGNDFFAIYETVQQARQECLEGKGPVFIEAMTYRMGAHSTSDDPSRYRPEGELEEWKTKCPILRLRRYLETQKLWDGKQEEKLLKEIHQTIDAAIETAKKTPPPPLRSLFEDVYFTVPPSLEEQYEALKLFFPESDNG